MVINKKTPHMFMWLCNGKEKDETGNYKFGEDQLLLPNKSGLQYFERLKEECIKLQETDTPLYLVYMGRMLTEGQKQSMQQLAEDPQMRNLMVVDYDDVEKEMGDVSGEFASLEGTVLDRKSFVKRIPVVVRKEQIIRKIQNLVNVIDDTGKTGRPALTQIIDSTRLVLLYNSAIIKDVAKKIYQNNPEKLRLLENSCPGLIYRDFDVTLLADEIPDLETATGYISSLNTANILPYVHRQIRSRTSNQDELDAIDEFFKTQIYDPKKFSANLEECKLAPKFYSDNFQKVEDFLSDFVMSSLHKKESAFQELFANLLKIENSFLGVSQDQAPNVGNIICEVFGPKNKSPYGAVQRHFRVTDHWYSKMDTDHELDDLIHNSKLHQIFNVGNDLTWERKTSEIISPDPTVHLMEPDSIVHPMESDKISKNPNDKMGGGGCCVIS
ncbi:MAG: hypothetical protein V4694_01075 [Pseudomonadota bacterium]